MKLNRDPTFFIFYCFLVIPIVAFIINIESFTYSIIIIIIYSLGMIFYEFPYINALLCKIDELKQEILFLKHFSEK